MGVTLNAGSGGVSVETYQRVSGQERQAMEMGYLPTFWALTAALTATANRFQFVLYTNNASAVVEVRNVILIPTSGTAVTGVFSGIWSQRIRTGPTTDPAGTGSLTIDTFDSADTLPASITAFSNPGTVPTGGTAKNVSVFLPQPDEIPLVTLTAQGVLNGSPFLGAHLYNHNLMGPHVKPITLRQDQQYEVQQDATAGTMTSFRILCIFTTK